MANSPSANPHDGFVIGENIATAPGKVVFRNQLIELLQFSPTTEQVYERPLLIFPPWINKFYILDLRPENSFIRWLVGQGYTVFVVSWANPDSELAQMGFEDYMRDGIFAALDAVKDATGVEDPNCVGYCIGGTLLAATLAYMAANEDRTMEADVSIPPPSGRRRPISARRAIFPSLWTRPSLKPGTADERRRRRARGRQDGRHLQHAARQ